MCQSAAVIFCGITDIFGIVVILLCFYVSPFYIFLYRPVLFNEYLCSFFVTFLKLYFFFFDHSYLKHFELPLCMKCDKQINLPFLAY